MEDVGATVFYNDEEDCLDYGCLYNNVEYDYDYADTEKETLYELYQYCLSPSLYDTGYNMLPLLGCTILFRLFIHIRKVLSSILKMLLLIFRSFHLHHNYNGLYCFIFQNTYHTRYFMYYQ